MNWCRLGWHCWHADWAVMREVETWFEYHHPQFLRTCCRCKKQRWQ